jgi:ATP-dependent Clp protease ATP-binding subunit ClpB
MVRLDMSEYSERHAVAKLIGAPAGYVGYEEGGVLTEAVRRRPYSVLLFDEIEKAHPDFADILLQILDDGRLTDNKGRTINFKNTIVMLTTNSKNLQVDFKPEVLGRLDAVLHYKPINQGIMELLVAKQERQVNEHLKTKNIRISLDKTAVQVLASRGYDPTYGARPLKTIFNKLVNRPLSHKLMEGDMTAATYTVSWDGHEMVFKRE